MRQLDYVSCMFFSYSILKKKYYCNMSFSLSLSLDVSFDIFSRKESTRKTKTREKKMLTASNYLRGLRHASVCVCEEHICCSSCRLASRLPSLPLCLQLMARVPLEIYVWIKRRARQERGLVWPDQTYCRERESSERGQQSTHSHRESGQKKMRANLPTQASQHWEMATVE